MFTRFKNFFFRNTSTNQTVAKNTFWLFMSEVTGRLLKMILIIYVARTLGVSGWGVFSYAISVGAIMMTFSDIGLGTLITRERVQQKKGYQKFISTALFIKCFILLISTILVIFISPLMSHVPEAKVLFPLIATILFFDSIRNLGLAINLASEKMEIETAVTIITNAVILGLGILLLNIRSAPESIALAYAIGSAIGFIVITIFIRKDISYFFFSVDRKMVKGVFLLAWPFALVTFTGGIIANADIFMLGIWRTPTDIGLYTSAQRVQQFILMLPSMIATVTFPLLSRMANNIEEQSHSVLNKTISFTMIIAIPVAVGGILLSQDIILLFFGPEYADATSILRILMIMVVVSSPLVVLSHASFAYNKQKSVALGYSFGVIANITLNLLLIPTYGAFGAAIAAVVSTTIITSIIWKKMYMIDSFKIVMGLKKIFLSVFIMAVVIVLLKYLETPTLFTILISSGTYMYSLILFKDQIFGEVIVFLKKRK